MARRSRAQGTRTATFRPPPPTTRRHENADTTENADNGSLEGSGRSRREGSNQEDELDSDRDQGESNGRRSDGERVDIDPAGRAAMEYVEANIEQANGGIKRKIARDLQVESPRKIRVLDLNLKFSILDKLDNLSKGNSTEAYAVPEKCKTNIRDYTKKFLLSPFAPDYLESIKTAVYVTDLQNSLPATTIRPESQLEPSATGDAIHEAIRHVLQNYKSAMKKEVKKSIENGWDITVLCEKLMAGIDDAEHCVEMWFRWAFIRNLYASAEGYDKEDGFWPMVDNNLEGIREQFQQPNDAGASGSTGVISQAEKDEIAHFKQFYEADRERYVDVQPTTRPDAVQVWDLTGSMPDLWNSTRGD